MILFTLCFMLYWLNMGDYGFLDTNETRFVSIAKDMLTHNNWANIKINNENYFNYSPLIFWLINCSCIIFEKISNVIVRIPFSLTTTLGIVFMFFMLKDILSKSYATIITLIFSTSLAILVFSRLATTDIIFTIYALCSLLLSIKALFSTNAKQKILLWLLVYIFIALATMTCGILGFLVPTVSIITMCSLTGNIKEVVNPRHFLLGFITFALITLPWIITMICQHGISFIKGYFSTLSIIKSFGIKELINVLTVFLVGFFPWIFSFLWIIFPKAKDIYNNIKTYLKDNSQTKLKDKWYELKTNEKFISVNAIIFFVILIFAIFWGYKNTHIILFLLLPVSCITGCYWHEYIMEKEHEKNIFWATLIPNLILIMCSIIGLFGHNIINKIITENLNNLIVSLVIIFFIIPLFGIFTVLLKGRKTLFTSNVILMIAISFILSPYFFNFMIANGGQKDLIEFANLAKKENEKLVAFISSKKHSITYYYDKEVIFKNEKDYKWLKSYLEENPQDYVIVEIKDLWEVEKQEIPYMLIDSGTRYCLIQHLPYGLKNTDGEEPEIIVY